MGGSFIARAPYLFDGQDFYVAATGFKAALPNGSQTWLNNTVPTNVQLGNYGDLLLSGTGSYWESQTATQSVEAEITVAGFAAGSAAQAGIWLWDSTNGFVWVIGPGITSSSPGVPQMVVQKYTYSGSGLPAYSASNVYDGWAQIYHLKLSVTSGTLSFELSLDGGQTFTVLQTNSVGTISNGGIVVVNAIVDVLSLLVK
jgi:hypothetical protein